MFPMIESLMRDYSILYTSDIKAAIEFTYNDDPCDGCDVSIYIFFNYCFSECCDPIRNEDVRVLLL